jgi:hypothetical protein
LLKLISLSSLLLLSLAGPASGVLIDTANGSGNTGLPFTFEPLANVGTRGSTTGIYLGAGVVLTANHAGAGPIEIGGTVYPDVPGSAVRLVNPDATLTDLLVFEIYPRPDLPDLVIAPVRPPNLSQIVIAGNGLDRGDPTSFDPNGTNPPGPQAGFWWGSGQHLRYGTNRIESAPPGGRSFNTDAFGSIFDGDAAGPEGQAVPGDSGGAAFWQAPSGEWQLAGVILAIVRYSGQPTNATFFGQTTYYADLSSYRSEIENLAALPEPGGALGPGAALVAGLAVRRRRQLAARMRVTASLSVDSLPIG